MNLAELYQKTPVERHSDIKVMEGRVLVKTADGCIDEYTIDADGELWLIRSNREERQDILAIKAKLGIQEVAP